MLFPPGMPPVPSSGTPALNPADEIWVENKTPEGKVSCKLRLRTEDPYNDLHTLTKHG